MSRRAVIVFLFVPIFLGCGEDERSSNPQAPSDTTTYGIHDLDLTVDVSSRMIGRGDTLVMSMVAHNPNDGPAQARFPTTCQEGFWVYHERGWDASPGYICGDLVTWFEMAPHEERQYEIRWPACPLDPGRFFVFVGFFPQGGHERYVAEPIGVEIYWVDEDVTGTWEGLSFLTDKVPGWEDGRFEIVVQQSGSDLTGTVRAGGPLFEIANGSIADNKITLTLEFDDADLALDFTGEVCGASVEGWRVLRALRSERVFETRYWHAHRVSE